MIKLKLNFFLNFIFSLHTTVTDIPFGKFEAKFLASTGRPPLKESLYKQLIISLNKFSTKIIIHRFKYFYEF